MQDYTEDNIRTLDWREHIRRRPGMYIGKLGDGNSADDGIYILLKEAVDNGIDEYLMGFGKQIIVTISEDCVMVRDFGRGIPLGKVKEVASKMNTGAKYDSKVFKKSVGLNGVGIKAVNALSKKFVLQSIREGKTTIVEFSRGELISEKEEKTDLPNGTIVRFIPDNTIFETFSFVLEHAEKRLRNYVYINAGLKIKFNDKILFSKNGLFDLLEDNMSTDPLYPIIHIKNGDIEVALTHTSRYGEDYYTYVNGQRTPQGGTHLLAFNEALVKTIREFYKKDFHVSDIKASIVTALSIRIEEPIFESQTKTKLGSKNMGPDGPSVRNFVVDFMKRELDNYLHKNPDTAEILLKKIQSSEKERRAISQIQKKARETAKKVSLHNKKLRDCRVTFNSNDERRFESSIFITEGDSASGSITKARDVTTQAVFSLKGKPLNSYGSTKKMVYENEEFNLLQAALNIEDGLENLRYNKVIVATDADNDGMHIRLLLLTFFLQFFPELVKNGHLYILQTPLFRVRSKKDTLYCYNETERNKAINKLGKTSEIVRFKGLGEISPDEFKHFIGKKIRLDSVSLTKDDKVDDLLRFYMGKNTDDRQQFIVENLRVEEEF
ncbi:MAG: ATP-binding protein [Bacteroidales bacterium]|nr:ATP-binding protein [Bacteroidales bacterium]